MKKKKNVNFLKIGVLLFSISLLLWNCEKSEDLIMPQSDNQIEVIKKKFEEEFNQQAYPYLKTPLWEAISSSTFNGEEYFEIPFDKLDRINFQKSTRLNTHKLVAKKVNNELQLNIVFFSIPIKSGKFIDHVSLDDLELKSGFISFFDLDKNAVDLYRYSKGKKFRNDYKIKFKNKNNTLHARMPQEGENCIETTVDHYTRTCWTVDDISWCSAYEFNYSYSYTTCDGGGGGGGNTYSETPPECSEPGYFKNDEGICVPQITNNLTGKAKCIYEKLKTLALFKSTIQKFEGNSNYNLTIESGDCANTDEGCTDGSGIENGNIKITMETSTSNPLGFASTLLHEGIHAELFKYVYEFNNGIDPHDRKNLLYHYFQQKKIQKPGLVNSVAQHQHMADKFVKPIAEAIRALDDNNYPLEYYMGFGWDGLRAYGYDGYFNNGSWVSLNKDQSTDYYKKQKIVNDNTKLKDNECN